MAAPRERFRDPTSALSTYEFEVNHYTEDAAGQSRTITRTAPLAGVGFVRQQGERAPFTFKLQGSILTQSQYDAMQNYHLACDSRTIFFRDFTGTEYEVLITLFDPQRVAVVRNRRDPSLMNIWKYRLEMEVIA